MLLNLGILSGVYFFILKIGQVVDLYFNCHYNDEIRKMENCLKKPSM